MEHVSTLQVLTTVSVEMDTQEMAALAQVLAYDICNGNVTGSNTITEHDVL